MYVTEVVNKIGWSCKKTTELSLKIRAQMLGSVDPGIKSWC